MWDLVGHDKAIARLDRALKAGRIAHFYLITGPARVGKTTLALRLAQALNCAGPAGRPCGECRACRRIEAGTHLDVRVIRLEPRPDGGDEGRGRPRSGEKNIGIDQVRELLHEAALSPAKAGSRSTSSRTRRTSPSRRPTASSSLLEEPPPQVVLILTAADANMLLPTIVSRCQPVRLQPVPADVIALHLQTRHGVEAGRAAVLARIAAGRIGWAIAAAGDPTQGRSAAKRSDVWWRWPTRGWRSALPSRATWPPTLGTNGPVFTSDWTYGLHGGATCCSSRRARRSWSPTPTASTRCGRRRIGCRRGRGPGFSARIGVARARLEQNVNARLALESLLLHIPLGRAD